MIPHKPGPANWPVGGSVVAVVGQEIKVKLPEDVERDPPVGRRDVVVGLAEHGVEAVQGHVLGQQAVGQPVDLQQPLQLLKHGRRNLLSHSARWVGQHLLCCVALPQWKSGPRFQSDWWRGPETCTWLRRSSGWSGGSGQWSDPAAERHRSNTLEGGRGALGRGSLQKTMDEATSIPLGGPYLHVSLFEECLVAVRRRVRNNHAIVFTLRPEAFV